MLHLTHTCIKVCQFTDVLKNKTRITPTSFIYLLYKNKEIVNVSPKMPDVFRDGRQPLAQCPTFSRSRLGILGFSLHCLCQFRITSSLLNVI